MSLVLFTSKSSANITGEFYNPLRQIKKITFQMQSSEIENLLVTKKKLEASSQLKAHVTWTKLNNKIVVKLIPNSLLDHSVTKLLEENFRMKTAIVLGSKFNRWIKGYKLTDKRKSQLTYTDPTGLLEKSEIVINLSRNNIIISEKKPIGSIRTSFELFYPIWSSSKAVIKSVSRVAYEGARILRTKTKIEYKQVEKNIYLPVKISSEATHGVSFESSSSIERNLNNIYIISDYKLAYN